MTLEQAVELFETHVEARVTWKDPDGLSDDKRGFIASVGLRWVYVQFDGDSRQVPVSAKTLVAGR